MTNKKLFEILTLVKSVKSNRWNDVMKIVEIMPTIIVKDKKWHDEYKQKFPEYSPLDLSKIETWSTYDYQCINLIFSNENNELRCDVQIYDGDMLTGYRTKLRFSATLIIPNDFIQTLEKSIRYALDILAEESYDEYLENQKKLWLSNFKSEILQ
jgi:hypothetical protein